MSTLNYNGALAKGIYFDDNNLWLDLTDGRKLSVPLVYFPRLLKATLEEKIIL